ncbi:phosphate-starvation-inducible PsiE family protein [Thermococcus piezophilus]|uniref:Phosphate-starvation-inducible E-like protein n=1 Tax=Thermococcus piezophilus TaxID=1712654 RepID=A0A172WEV0_9EURY|nr:phosphate-starvation-inducible PsiE family protein [Thermococcus piezophilus]ANF21931.1 hypothetical protein A7C91_00985 [Thermococcus piezophilus]
MKMTRIENENTAQYTQVHKLFRKVLEISFDFVVMMFLFFILYLTVYSIYLNFKLTYRVTEPKLLIANVLVTIILIETYRILIIYLRQHRVSLTHILEVGIVALIQKLIVASDFEHLDSFKLLSIAALLFVLGYFYIKVGED